MVHTPEHDPETISEEQLQENIAEADRRNECRARGGIWDSATQTCKSPQQVEQEKQALEQPPQQDVTLETPETFTDPATGRASGITLPDGRTFLGLSPEEVQQVATGEQQRVARPAGTAPVGTQTAFIADVKRKLQVSSQVGLIDFATAQQAEELGLNVKEFLLAGAANIVPAALGAATTLGAIGAAATIPAGGAGAIPAATLGAVGGAITGFYVGVNNNIKAQKGDLISGKRTELKQRQRALQNYIQAANTNPAEAETYVEAFNTELSLIRKDFNSLTALANEDLTLWGGQDGTPQIISYDIYFESIEPSLIARMDQAVLKPDPTRAFLTVEDFE